MKKIPFLSENFAALSAHIKHDGVAVLPTDTIPGFSIDPESEQALQHLQSLKQRPIKNPFLLLVPDYLSAERLCDFSNTARDLVNQFWPGPLTLILPRKKGVLPHYFPNEPELALRIPGDENLRKFLNIFGAPLVSTSVNISGKPPLIFSADIEKEFHDERVLLSLPKESAHNIEPSTIVRVRGEEVEVLRRGYLKL